LPELTRRTILLMKQSHPDWGCQKISDLLLRGPALPASAAAVARVLRDAGYALDDAPGHAAHEPPARRFERAAANQLWQPDLFTFVLKRQNRRVYLVAQDAQEPASAAAAPDSVTALRAHRERMVVEGRDVERGPVFVDTVGGLLRKLDFLCNWFRPVLKCVGLRPVRFHALRHTTATLMLSSGVNPKVVSERLGPARSR